LSRCYRHLGPEVGHGRPTFAHAEQRQAAHSNHAPSGGLRHWANRDVVGHGRVGQRGDEVESNQGPGSGVLFGHRRVITGHEEVVSRQSQALISTAIDNEVGVNGGPGGGVVLANQSPVAGAGRVEGVAR